MLRTTARLALAAGALTFVFGSMCVVNAQRAGGPLEPVSYAPKPRKLTAYEPPHKPHTKLADTKAAHKGQKEWSEWVVKDDYLTITYGASTFNPRPAARFRRASTPTRASGARTPQPQAVSLWTRQQAPHQPGRPGGG